MALLAVLGSGTWLVIQQDSVGCGYEPWFGMATVGGHPAARGPGVDGSPVEDISQARDRATSFAEHLAPGLRVGEVMRFTNHYYAERQEPDGDMAPRY